MGRRKGSKNKPKELPVTLNVRGYVADPAGNINLRVSKATRANMAALKVSMGAENQDEVLERMAAMLVALQLAAT